jgi:exodeoxyribonuclease VII large subunit
MLNGVAGHRRHLDGCAALLASLSYHGVLQRGFALVRDGAGQSVRSVAQVDLGQRLDIEFADGRVATQAMETRKTQSGKAAPASPPAAPARTKSERRGGNQGSLF